MKIDDVMALVRAELAHVILTHEPIASPHEGYAVIKEELDELWTEVKNKHPSMPAMRTEALQVAAMGARFLLDVSERS